MTITKALPEVVQFTRKRDFTVVRSLGQGGFGQTVLLFDDTIGLHLVCKKYCPQDERIRKDYYKNFLNEARLLYDILHPNVVRAFGHYFYPESLTGYILMEWVEGLDIEAAIRANPQNVGDIFRQTIDGFAYLESIGVLHRDIRPQNVLVRSDGVVKIIDLGFGKRVRDAVDFDKSITLNWWCEPPSEFDAERYDFQTEVYFVGRLFAGIWQDGSLGDFPHAAILGKMCRSDPSERYQSFSAVRSALLEVKEVSPEFDHKDLETYREFAGELGSLFTKMDHAVKYVQEPDIVVARLEQTYRECMLEEILHNALEIARCFVVGAYWYNRHAVIRVDTLRDFLSLMRRSGQEKRAVILANLHGRLNAIPRKSEPKEEEDIPF